VGEWGIVWGSEVSAPYEWKGAEKIFGERQWIVAQEKESEGSKNIDKKIVVIKLKILNKKGEKLRKNKIKNEKKNLKIEYSKATTI
jgi:hypothetical protein